MKLETLDITALNKDLKSKSPSEIIEWAISFANRPILTTNFGPYSASLLYAASNVAPNINVIWCDSGYNTPQTYKFAQNIVKDLNLNLHIYSPKQTTAFRDASIGIPQIDTQAHQEFTEQVKLEPFRRAFDEHKPDVWLTNLRKDQTEFRNNLDIVYIDKRGILKVCPFFYYSEFEMEIYLKTHNLENELRYFDPTKVLEKRECGLHL